MRDIPMTWRVYYIANGQSAYNVLATDELIELLRSEFFDADSAMAIVPENVAYPND